MDTSIAETKQDELFMRQAIRVAKAALDIGEVPVGCVIVMPTENGPVVVSHGANQVNATRDGTVPFRSAPCNETSYLKNAVSRTPNFTSNSACRNCCDRSHVDRWQIVGSASLATRDFC